MQRYIQRENIARYRKLIAVVEDDLERDAVRYQILLRLLADEEQRDRKH